MRLIDADKLHYTRVLIPQKDGRVSEMLHAAVLSSEIKDAPTADVQEVRHGKWVGEQHFTDTVKRECSRCGTLVSVDYFCSHCGAKMHDDSVLTNIYNCEACKKLCCDGCELYEGTNMDSQQ